MPTAILDKYQEASNLLDPHLESLVTPLVLLARDEALSASVQGTVFALLYTICKVRGYKTVLKLFTHETADFHPILARLLKIDPADHSVWHARYIMLLWQSLICLLPFDLAVLDSGDEESDAQKILRVAKVRRSPHPLLPLPLPLPRRRGARPGSLRARRIVCPPGVR